MTSDAPTPRARRARVLTTAVGLLLAVLAGVFVVRTLGRDWDEITEALADAAPGWVALGGLLAGAGMVAIAIPWRQALRAVGEDLPLGQVVARYFVGEIGKYLPGGVWPVLGRGELAARAGVARRAAYSSVALSLATLYLAAMALVVLGLPILLGGGDGTGPVAIVVLLPIGLVALHPRVLHWAVGTLERLTNRTIALVVPPWGQTVRLVAGYLPAWVCIGLATAVVARALDPSAPVGEVVVAAVLSWVVGFVLVPVPGGVGVREAAFVAAAGSLDPGIAAATAVLARAIFVAVDAGGALLGSAALRRGASGQEELSGPLEKRVE